MKMLITGFEAFSGMPVNPSQVIVDSLEKVSFKTNFELEIIRAILPVDFAVSGKIVTDLILAHEPDIFIATGVDFAKKSIELEQIAHKNSEFLTPELLASINPDLILDFLPENIPSSVDLEAILERLIAKGVRAIVSPDTGQYVCNHVYYLASTFEHYTDMNINSFFVHIPYPYPYWIDEAHIIPDFTIKEIQESFIEIIGETTRWYLDSQRQLV